MTVPDTPWCHLELGLTKLFLQKGQFTSTILDSTEAGGEGGGPVAVEFDGTNSPWCGRITPITDGRGKLFLQQGLFTSTILTSLDVHDTDSILRGISFDGENTPWCGDEFGGADKLYLQSGQFNSTLKDSLSVTSINNAPNGISFDGCDTPWCGAQNVSPPDTLYLQSGQFTSTVKASLDVSGVTPAVRDISWDGINTPWCEGTVSEKLFLQSGPQFTSTLKTSLDVDSIANGVQGIGTTRVEGRLFGVTPFEEASEEAEEDAITEDWGDDFLPIQVPGGGGGGGEEDPDFRIHATFQPSSWPEVGSLYSWGDLAAFSWQDLCGGVVQDKDILAINISRKLGDIRNRLTVGRCDFLLDNRDGKYSPENPGFVMRPGEPVGVKVITENGSVYPLFSGFVDSYTIQPAQDRLTAHVGASDIVKLLRRRINLGLRIGTNPSSLMTDILSAAGIPKDLVDIGTATDSITVAFIDNVPAGDAITQIINAGAHYAYVNNRGQLVFRPRGTVPGLTASQSYDQQFFSLSYSLRDDSVVNEALVKVDPFRLPETAQATVAWIEGPVTLTVQGTLEFLLSFRDPLTGTSPFPCMSIAIPVSSDDYLSFEECNSPFGVNLTDQLSVTVINTDEGVVPGATSALVKINNAGCPGCLTKFQLRGIPLTDQPQNDSFSFDRGSQEIFGRETLVIEQNLIQDIAFNNDLAKYLLRPPEPEVRWSKKNWYPDIYLWDLFQHASLVESNTGISSLWLLEEVEHTIDLSRGHQHTLTARVRQDSKP